ncbi:MAG TPA: helix-hairpin-helix domain-containing protein [Acidimicrobiales bacterium]|nr:helix-hairpin-helix domain-containing protein [Acidimicrobiales bacterium]
MPDLVSLRKRLDALPVEPSQIVAGVVVLVIGLVATLSWLLSGGRGPSVEGGRGPGGGRLGVVDGAAADLPQARPTPEVSPPGTGAGEQSVVHVSGAVARPGLVRLPAAARVADALAAVGGPAPDADLDRVNLAARIADGERLHVPRRGEVVHEELRAGGQGAGSAAAEARAPPLDLNAATVEQLDSLPGIGPATAQAIVDHRARHGPFRSVAQLLQVKGIGEAKLAALRPKVRV